MPGDHLRRGADQQHLDGLLPRRVPLPFRGLDGLLDALGLELGLPPPLVQRLEPGAVARQRPGGVGDRPDLGGETGALGEVFVC